MEQSLFALVATDPGFYRATSVTTWDSNADVMASMIMPCLLIVGELDPRLAQVRQCTSGLPNATFFSLPGCDHVASAYRSELVIPHLKAFPSKVHS